MKTKKWVFGFDELDAVKNHVGQDGDAVRGLLGGKGANLAEMVRIGLPAPHGFNVSTEACNAFLKSGGTFPKGMWDQVLSALQTVEAETEKRFGSDDNPLLDKQNTSV